MSKYNVGDKFTIEIKELINGSNDKMFYKSDCYSIIFGEEQLDKLQKYNGSTISEDTLEMVRMKALNEGRNDAWELARKMCDYAYEGKTQTIFGCSRLGSVMSKLTPQEALAMLEAYEKEQNIKVGDIIICYDKEGVVTKVDDNYFNIVYEDGSSDKISQIICKKKTGKHIDIQSVLKQIGSDADELS